MSESETKNQPEKVEDGSPPTVGLEVEPDHRPAPRDGLPRNRRVFFVLEALVAFTATFLGVFCAAWLQDRQQQQRQRDAASIALRVMNADCTKAHARLEAFEPTEPFSVLPVGGFLTSSAFMNASNLAFEDIDFLTSLVDAFSEWQDLSMRHVALLDAYRLVVGSPMPELVPPPTRAEQMKIDRMNPAQRREHFRQEREDEYHSNLERLEAMRAEKAEKRALLTTSYKRQIEAIVDICDLISDKVASQPHSG